MPSGVRITAAIASGTEWVTGKKLHSNGPIRWRLCGARTCIFSAETPFSSILRSATAAVKRVQ